MYISACVTHLHLKHGHPLVRPGTDHEAMFVSARGLHCHARPLPYLFLSLLTRFCSSFCCLRDVSSDSALRSAACLTTTTSTQEPPAQFLDYHRDYQKRTGWSRQSRSAGV